MFEDLINENKPMDKGRNENDTGDCEDDFVTIRDFFPDQGPDNSNNTDKDMDNNLSYKWRKIFEKSTLHAMYNMGMFKQIINNSFLNVALDKLTDVLNELIADESSIPSQFKGVKFESYKEVVCSKYIQYFIGWWDAGELTEDTLEDYLQWVKRDYTIYNQRR